MNLLSQLPSTTTKSSKRVGRGYGSGVGGHTCRRGAKGDKARGKTKLTFDGSKIKKGWIKRTPFLRGKHRLISHRPVVNFNLEQLNTWFKSGAKVNRQRLAKAARLSLSQLGTKPIKILSGGDIKKSLIIDQIMLSKKAEEKIIKAGGRVNK